MTPCLDLSETDARTAGQDAEFGALMTVLGVKGARSGHAFIIARTADNRNGPILRWDALGIIVGHASRFVLGETVRPRKTSTA